MRISMPATTDWVNDAEGEPLFLVPTEANKGLARMLPVVLSEVRKLVGERRVTVVFDRGGNADSLLMPSPCARTTRNRRVSGFVSLCRSAYSEPLKEGEKIV
jgi:hypothetical protein